MGDEERTAKIDRLLRGFSEATERKAALVSEAQQFADRIGDVREALGNPFFYSGRNYERPENANKSIVNFTGYKSHEPGLRLVRNLNEADRELNAIREQLRELGVSVE